MAPKYLQEWRLRDFAEQPMLVIWHTEKLFSDVQLEPPAFWFVPMASGPLTGR